MTTVDEADVTMRANYTGYLLQPDGPEVYVMENDQFAEDDPLVLAHPNHFDRVEKIEVVGGSPLGDDQEGVAGGTRRRRTR